MRAILQAITEELQRLKADGEYTVAVSEETLMQLRALVATQSGKTATPPAEQSGPVGGAAVKAAFANWQPKSESRADPVKSRPATAVTTASSSVKPAAAAAPKLPPPPVLALPTGDKATRWAALLALAAADPVCVANLRAGKKAVIGAGSLGAKIFFVGDGLGSEAGVDGDAFAGPAGQTLGKMIAAMGLSPAEAYVGNLVCWRPPLVAAALAEQAEGKAPTADELAYGLPFLRAAIEVVQPEMIVALGGAAAQALLGGKLTKLPEVRSRWHEFAGIPLMVTYHPSYVLQSNSTKAKRAVWEDLLKVMERGELPISAKQRGYFQ
jgi:uracil-DNA glycosylase